MLERPTPHERWNELRQASDEGLHDFLTHVDAVEFEKHWPLKAKAQGELNQRMHRQNLLAHAQTLQVGRRTLWICLASLVAALLSALFALLALRR